MILSVLKKYIWLVNIILLAGLAYILAQVIGDEIEARISQPIYSSNDSTSSEEVFTNSPAQVRLNYYKIIVEKNIFSLENSSLNASAQGSGQSVNQDAPETTLNLELLGTFIDPARKSVAIIKNEDNSKVSGYVNGDSINIIESENVKLLSIGNCRAVLERSIGQEAIKCRDLDDKKGGPSTTRLTSTGGNQTQRTRGDGSNDPNSTDIEDGITKIDDNNYEVDKETLDKLLSDPGILTQARVIPQDDGLRFFAVRPTGVFYKIGIRSGDTLHRINDVELTNVENALGLIEKLKDEAQFTIVFTRRGQRVTSNYSVR